MAQPDRLCISALTVGRRAWLARLRAAATARSFGREPDPRATLGIVAPPVFLGSVVRPQQRQLQRCCDGLRDFGLNHEDVLKFTIERLRSQFASICGINQFGHDSHTVPLFAYCAFQQRAHAQFFADLFAILLVVVLETKRRAAADDLELSDLSQGGDQLLRQSIRKILVARITASLSSGRTAIDCWASCFGATVICRGDANLVRSDFSSRQTSRSDRPRHLLSGWLCYS
jgi:hypothetical protein